VPLTKAAAGIKRVVALAYLIVWAWEEHKLAAKALRSDPTNRIVLLFDEVEAHLHPKWQRRFLPALVKVIESSLLENHGASTQFICTTHAPLILGSVETIWRSEKDCLNDLDLDNDRQVRIEQVPFEKHGNADSWLESTLFDLPSAYSTDAEKVMARADAFMQEYPDPRTAPVDPLQDIHRSLMAVLGGDDEYFGFWNPYYRVAGGRR
jgi:predicted ATP-binding protein involved in virulence